MIRFIISLTLSVGVFQSEGLALPNAGKRFSVAAGACPIFGVGSALVAPPDLFSQNGILKLSLSYRSSIDANGNTQFCYLLPDGRRSPTLHLNPGEHLVITLTNDTPAPASDASMQMQMPPLPNGKVCGSSMMTASSTNLHFHGTNTPPTCHQDESIFTMINSGESFTYDLQIPNDEPPGLYWYHPHVHGMSENAVLGGASGAIIIEGIQNLQPEVAGLSQQLLIFRDNLVSGAPTPGGLIPSWDLSLNFIPIPYPDYKTVKISMKEGEKQLWRVLNASADTILDLQLQYDGVNQPLLVVALDGVPTGSQDGIQKGKVVEQTHILLAPGARAEFIVVGPLQSITSAVLKTLKVDTGPGGDNDPLRPLATVQLTQTTPVLPTVPPVSGPAGVQRFSGILSAKVAASRKLYFSEILSNPNDPSSPTNFYITVDGQTPVLFDPKNPPAITTQQGAVEDWVVENRTKETHVFHIHQIHFLLLEKNGTQVTADQQQFLDLVEVPYWSGSGPYPSVKVRMDFRGLTVGDFVYHCHILQHEDNGMMAVIRVLPTPLLLKNESAKP